MVDLQTDTYTTEVCAPNIIAQSLASLLVFLGNLVYGKEPSYLKFRSVEIVARIPYQSWAAASFTLLTCFFSNEEKALSLSRQASSAEFAQANETMHVIVISQLAQKKSRVGFIRYTAIPMVFSFLYFWFSYILYLIHPRTAYELNYLFEDHAYAQYDQFLKTHETELKEKPIVSTFLHSYGRNPKNEYEFFCSVRDDERTHRDTSARMSRSV